MHNRDQARYPQLTHTYSPSLQFWSWGGASCWCSQELHHDPHATNFGFEPLLWCKTFHISLHMYFQELLWALARDQKSLCDGSWLSPQFCKPYLIALLYWGSSASWKHGVPAQRCDNDAKEASILASTWIYLSLLIPCCGKILLWCIFLCHPRG